VIVDNLQVPHAYKVQAWVARQQATLELFFLPPYAPELNPDEYLNNGSQTTPQPSPQAGG
jgi:hypothetical protein